MLSLRSPTSWVICAAILIPAALASAAQPPLATGYAIFSTGNVELTSYSTALGPIYAGGDLHLDFGYGIQRPAANVGDMFTRGSYTQDSLSQVTGNVFANQNVTLNGSATITGNVTYGNTYTHSGSTVTGTASLATPSVAAVTLPSATSFSPGLNNENHSAGFSLAPGSYAAVSETGLFQSVHLSSGDYFLSSLSLLNSTSLYLDYTGNQPIHVFVQGDITLSSGFNVYVNGVQVGTTGLDPSLAKVTLFETHGNFTLPGGFLNYFYGTIFAPTGNVTMNLQDMDGSIISGGTITGNVYMTLQPLPEPASSLLLAGGCAALLTRRRGRR